MRISIALGTYNGERFLREQLESLARQALLPYELVASDDNSSDATLAILDDFARRAPFRVRTYRNDQNVGWQDNFMRAALRCEGDWIAFCDQDDVWLPRKLQRVAACIKEHPHVVMVVHSAELVRENLESSGGRLPDIRRFRLVPPLHNHPFLTQLGFATCFKRDLLCDVPVEVRPCDPNIPNRRQSHDQLVTLLANAVGTVAYVPDVLALYRRHGNAVTGQAGTGAHQRNLRTLVRGVMDAGSDRYQFQSDVAQRNAEFLRKVQRQQPAERARCYGLAADFYGSLAEWLACRAEMYESKRALRARLKLLANAVRAGAYKGIGNGVGLGWRSLAKDVAVTALEPLAMVLNARRG